MPLLCDSNIDRVDVYARGAIVRRAIVLPKELSKDVVEIAVPGITRLAEPGSVRAIVDGEREVVSLRSRVVVPDARVSPGVLAARAEELTLTLGRLTLLHQQLEWRRAALAAVTLDPGMARRVAPIAPDARVEDALAIDAIVDQSVTRLDERIAELAEEIESTRRKLVAAQLELAQGTEKEREGEHKAEIEVVARLAASAAELRGLAITYVIRAARWWPAYVARLRDGGTKVSLRLDAFVAQASGEDWRRAKLAVSTADLATDAKLPELRSLRLGRAQSALKRGYRPAPEGLELMFVAYERAEALVIRVPPPAKHAAETTRMSRIAKDVAAATVVDAPASLSTLLERGELKEEPADMEKPRRPAPEAFGSAAPAGGAPQPARARGEPVAARSAGIVGGIGGLFEQGAMELGREVITAIEPADAWMDFDTLEMGDPRSRADRGRLRRAREAAIDGAASRAVARIEALPAPVPSARDPRSERGQYDHTYEAEGSADIPANGRPHRISIASGEATATPRFVTVPREAAEVYREVELKHPLDAPLLGGPVEIFVDGALLTTSDLAHTDRGGTIHLGLGVEERIRVARNVRVEESSIGLIGSSTAIDHAISIELASSLGRDVTVDVLDRIPVTDDKEVEIKTLYARPPLEEYLQTERGVPIRKGVRFRIEVPKGEKRRIEVGYRVAISSKNEIVGGNRRD